MNLFRKAVFAAKLLLAGAVLWSTALEAQVQYPIVTSYQSSAFGTSNMVKGSDGSIWFIGNSYTDDSESVTPYANQVAPNGTVTQYELTPTLIGTPVGYSLAAGPDGALWFTAGSGSGAVIGRITTTGAISTFQIPASPNGLAVFGNEPGAIIAGPDGAMWFTDPSNPYIWRVTTAGVFSDFALTNPAFGITTGPDNNLWVSEYAITGSEDSDFYQWSGAVAQVTTAGKETVFALTLQNQQISSTSEFPMDTFAIGPDGALWFTEYNGADVGRVTTAGAVTTGYAGVAYGITAGNDGALWVTQPGPSFYPGTAALVRISPTTGTNSVTLNQAFSEPFGITTAVDGTLWFNDNSSEVVGHAVLQLTVPSTSLPGGMAGTAYPATQLQALGGVEPYTWSLSPTAGSLPPGLTLGSSGAISGTPTATGTFAFSAIVSDSGNQSTSESLSISVTVGAPSNITPTSGSGQSAPINTAFANPLAVTVKDVDGNPISGAKVTFTAPASSGPSGTFVGAGGTVVVATNAAGVATSPAFMANAIAGGYSVGAAASGLNAAFTLTNTAGAAAGITATSGTPQTASIDTAFAAPLAATVRDASGNPIAGVNVTFTAPATGASGAFAGAGATVTVATNASGTATSPAFTANGTAGGYSVMATAAGLTGSATFSLTNSAGAAAGITATSGGGQTAPVSTAFASRLVVTVKDAGGNPVSNATVTFAAPGSGASGTFAGGNTAATNAQGVATSPVFTANGAAGTYTVSATVAGVSGSATFSLTNTAGAAAGVTATSGGGQSAQVGAPFANPLVVTVKDASGNPVSNATVTFAPPGSGAGGTFTGGGTANTNAQGVATSTAFTANGTAGTYTVSATVAGVSGSATFSLTNLTGAAASVTASSGGGQTVAVNTAFTAPFMATVKDASGNLVSGANVTFAAPGAGASGTFAGGGATAVVATNAAGVAVSPTFKANGTAGTYSVSASVTGVAGPATFSLTNTAGAPASIAVASGSRQSAQINNTFSSALTAIVKDAGGNPVSGASVTFAAAGSGASGAFQGSAVVVTNAAGIAASPAFTANATAGSYSVSATVAGVTGGATFALTNTAGAPATITVTAGSPQTAKINAAFAPLVVTVKDSGGNPVSNVNVTFTAPPSGASVIFAGGAVSANVQTNGGVATSPALNANATSGTYTVSASVAGLAASAPFTLTNSTGAPASITAVPGGSGQSAKVGTAFTTPLAVAVNDSGGNPVPNVTVTFAAPGSAATGAFAGGGATATAQTNAAGVATSPGVTANATAGSYTVSATVNGVTASAAFALTNTAGAPGSITATSGTPQSTQTKSAFSFPLVVLVKDANGNAVANVTVTFTAPPSGASGAFAGAGATGTATTNATGVATAPTLVANATSGTYAVSASVPGAATPASFSLTNSAGTPASVTATSGGGQNARVNSAFNNPFIVTVKDANGNPVSGVNVTFTAPGTGASGTFSGGLATVAVPTNAAGVATSPALTANAATGTFTVTAAVAGVASQATFSLTNSAGIVITTTTLPNGTAGLQYSAILASQNGVPPYSWTITTGVLPAGITLNAATGAISGMPTAAGTFPITVKLTDSSTPPQSTTQALSIFINPPVTEPITPTFTISGIPATPTPGATITNGAVQLSQASSAAYAGTLSLSFTPDASVTGTPAGYTGDAGFVGAGGAKSVTASVSIPAATTSVAIPSLDPGTVAGEIAVALTVGGQNVATSTITIAPAAPAIEVNSVQITNVTATGFDVELVATSTTRDLTNAVFTFAAASGSQISGASTFTVDVSTLLAQWFASADGLTYGGSFTLTLPFTLSGPASAIQSVSVTVANSVGTSGAVSGTQ